MNRMHVGKSLKNINKGTTSSYYNTLVTGIWTVTPPPTSFTPNYRTDSLLLQEGFLYSQDEEKTDKLFVSVPSHFLTWFITLKFTFCAGGIWFLVNTKLFKSCIKKLIQNYTTSHFCTSNHQKASLSLISLTKKEAEHSSFSFKRNAAEHLDCLHWL